MVYDNDGQFAERQPVNHARAGARPAKSCIGMPLRAPQRQQVEGLPAITVELSALVNGEPNQSELSSARTAWW